MNLNEYKEKYDLSCENLARQLGFTNSKMLRLCHDPLNVKLIDAMKIVQQTEGEVSMQDLLPKC
jgi:plasmid maintenance system antidote protein VapI